MFLAIINDSYVVVKEEIQNEKEDFEVEDYLKRGYNNMLVSFLPNLNLLGLNLI
jgi:hypothetical protein